MLLTLFHWISFLPQKLIKKKKKMYCVFGSQLSNKPYAQFMTQAKDFNRGWKIDLLKGMSTRTASYFYCMHQLLCQKPALATIITTRAWQKIDFTTDIQKVVDDINDKLFWKAILFILRCVWPELRALCLGDFNCLGMHQIYYLSYCTSVHINK